MSLRRVIIADEASGQRVPAYVPQSRLLDLDGGFRRIGGISALGVANDFLPLNGGRNVSARDAQEALAFLVSQLAYVESGIFERYYTPMQYDKLVPISFEAGEHATSIEYEITDQVGQARMTDSAADDTPTVDVGYARKSFGIAHFTVGYQFTQQELRTSAFLKRPLPERRLATAMQAYQRELNRIALHGDTTNGFTGLLNNANVTHATASNGAWDATATTAEILADFNFGLFTVWNNSKFNTVPDTVLVPPTAYQYISSAPASPTIPTVTILQYMKMNNLYKDRTGGELMIEPCYESATAGASSASRAVYYKRDPNTLIFHVPMPLRFLAPQLVGTYVKVIGEFRASTVEVRRPTDMYYQDGV